VKDNVLNEYYSKYYSDPSEIHKSEGITHDDPKAFSKHIFRLLKIQSQNIKILDYGGGSGILSYLIAKQLLNQCSNIEITIIDYSNEKLVNSDTKNIQVNKTSPDKLSELTQGGYTLIIASAVIEHVFYSGTLIKQLLNSMDKGGYLYIRTPYIFPLYKFLLNFGIEIDLLFPQHVHDFSKKFFEKLPNTMNTMNLKVVNSQPGFFEYSFKKHFFQALLSRIIRFPYTFNKNYPFVGGWEIIYRNNI